MDTKFRKVSSSTGVLDIPCIEKTSPRTYPGIECKGANILTAHPNYKIEIYYDHRLL